MQESKTANKTQDFQKDTILRMWLRYQMRAEMATELRKVNIFANKFLAKSTIIIYSDPFCHHISSYFSAIPKQLQIMP